MRLVTVADIRLQRFERRRCNRNRSRIQPVTCGRRFNRAFRNELDDVGDQRISDLSRDVGQH